MTDEREVINTEADDNEVDFNDNTPMIPYVSDKSKYYFLLFGVVLAIITAVIVVSTAPDKQTEAEPVIEKTEITQYII